MPPCEFWLFFHRKIAQTTTVHSVPACTFLSGPAGSVLHFLGSTDVELVRVSLSILANMLAFSDTPLVSREECVYAVKDCLDDVLSGLETTAMCDVVLFVHWLLF